MEIVAHREAARHCNGALARSIQNAVEHAEARESDLRNFVCAPVVHRRHRHSIDNIDEQRIFNAIVEVEQLHNR